MLQDHDDEDNQEDGHQYEHSSPVHAAATESEPFYLQVPYYTEDDLCDTEQLVQYEEPVSQEPSGVNVPPASSLSDQQLLKPT